MLTISPYSILQVATYSPEVYNETTPRCYFFHGMGQYGNDPNKIINANQGIIQLADGLNKLGIALVIPQAPTASVWGAKAIEPVAQLMAQTPNAPLILTGLSAGVHASMRLYTGYGMPNGSVNNIKSMLLLSGQSRPNSAELYPYDKAISKPFTWIGHGAADTVLPIVHGRNLSNDFIRLDPRTIYTEVATAKHDSAFWRSFYTSPLVHTWMASTVR